LQKNKYNIVKIHCFKNNLLKAYLFAHFFNGKNFVFYNEIIIIGLKSFEFVGYVRKHKQKDNRIYFANNNCVMERKTEAYILKLCISSTKYPIHFALTITLQNLENVDISQ